MSFSRSSGYAAVLTPSSGRGRDGRGLLERVPEPTPFRDAAVDDVDHLLRAEALDQARGGRGALTGSADHRDRPVGVKAIGDLGDVMPGCEHRTGDVALVPLLVVAHVEDLDLLAGLGALVQLLHGLAFDAFGRLLLLAPAGHAAVQKPAKLTKPDRDRQTTGVPAVFVIAAHKHDLLVAIGQPREL